MEIEETRCTASQPLCYVLGVTKWRAQCNDTNVTFNLWWNVPHPRWDHLQYRLSNEMKNILLISVISLNQHQLALNWLLEFSFQVVCNAAQSSLHHKRTKISYYGYLNKSEFLPVYRGCIPHHTHYNIITENTAIITRKIQFNSVM